VRGGAHASSGFLPRASSAVWREENVAGRCSNGRAIYNTRLVKDQAEVGMTGDSV